MMICPSAKLLYTWCREAGVELSTYDIQFGKLPISGLPKLVQYIIDNYHLRRCDRLTLVAWMSGMEKEIRLFSGHRWAKGAGYARVIEAEIERIAGMKEPHRTVEAVALLKRLRDARTVAGLGYGQVMAQRWKLLKEPVEQLEQMAKGDYGKPPRPRNLPNAFSMASRRARSSGRRSGSSSGTGS